MVDFKHALLDCHFWKPVLCVACLISTSYPFLHPIQLSVLSERRRKFAYLFLFSYDDHSRPCKVERRVASMLGLLHLVYSNSHMPSTPLFKTWATPQPCECTTFCVSDSGCHKMNRMEKSRWTCTFYIKLISEETDKTEPRLWVFIAADRARERGVLDVLYADFYCIHFQSNIFLSYFTLFLFFSSPARTFSMILWPGLLSLVINHLRHYDMIDLLLVIKWKHVKADEDSIYEATRNLHTQKYCTEWLYHPVFAYCREARCLQVVLV